MNGYATELAFWREEAPLGDQQGDAYRPPGIVDVAFRPVVAGSYETRDILRGLSETVVTQQAWQISMRREPKVSGFENFWLDAITDAVLSTEIEGEYEVETREKIDSPDVHTFGLEFVLEDGTRRRFIGAALMRVDWLIQSGRLIAEEVEFTALQSETFAGDVREAVALTLPALTSLDASFYFRPGTAWPEGDATKSKVRCMSAQLIWEREIAAAQFNAAGKATRHAITGGWDLVARASVTVPKYWATLHETTPARMRLDFGRDSILSVECQTRAKLSGHSVLGTGQINHLIDMQAVRPTGTRAIYTLKKYQPI